MKKQSFFIKLSLMLIIISFLIFINEYFQIIPTFKIFGGGIMWLVPSIIGIISTILSIIGINRKKTKLSKVTLVISIVLIFSIHIIWYGGTLLFGV